MPAPLSHNDPPQWPPPFPDALLPLAEAVAHELSAEADPQPVAVPSAWLGLLTPERRLGRDLPLSFSDGSEATIRLEPNHYSPEQVKVTVAGLVVLEGFEAVAMVVADGRGLVAGLRSSSPTVFEGMMPEAMVCGDGRVDWKIVLHKKVAGRGGGFGGSGTSGGADAAQGRAVLARIDQALTYHRLAAGLTDEVSSRDSGGGGGVLSCEVPGVGEMVLTFRRHTEENWLIADVGAGYRPVLHGMRARILGGPGGGEDRGALDVAVIGRSVYLHVPGHGVEGESLALPITLESVRGGRG